MYVVAVNFSTVLISGFDILGTVILYSLPISIILYVFSSVTLYP